VHDGGARFCTCLVHGGTVRGTTAVRIAARHEQCERDIEMNEKLLGDLSAKLAEMAASNPAKDFQKNVRGVLAGAFSRLDLVSREEYDVQVEVLARAREKLAVLEARVAELEAKLAARDIPDRG
jgi:BMFP domain-containing protein YqiC